MAEGGLFQGHRFPGSWSANSVPNSEVSCPPHHSKMAKNSLRKPSPEIPNRQLTSGPCLLTGGFLTSETHASAVLIMLTRGFI